MKREDVAGGLLFASAAMAAIYWLSKKAEGGGRMQVFTTKRGFVEAMNEDARKVGQEFQIPPALILTQAAHESAFGASQLAQKAFNLFGFTGESWKRQGKMVVEMPTREFIKGVWVKLTRPFRAYTTTLDSMRDYARLLTTQPRYSKVIEYARAGNLQRAFDELGRSGYATDPNYSAKLTGVYQTVKSFTV